MTIASILTLIIGSVLFLIFLWLGIYPLLHIGKVKYEKKLCAIEESRKWLEQHIEQAKEKVLIVSGSFDPYIYNPIAGTIKRKLKENSTIKIYMLAGPEILTWDGVNEIYNLAQSNNRFGGRLQINFLSERPIQHYRVIDATHLFVEHPHALREKQRIVETLKNGFFKPWQYKEAFLRKMRQAKRASKIELVPIETLARQ